MSSPELQLASDLARIRAIYKLIPLPSPLVVLEILSPSRPPVLSDGVAADDTSLVLSRVADLGYTAVDRVEIGNYPARALFSLKRDGVAASLIIVHGTYPELKASLGQSDIGQDDDEIFAALYGLLSPGGVLAGCIENSSGIRRRFARGSGNTAGHKPGLSGRTLRAKLAKHQFSETRVFALYPGMHSPLNLAQVNESPSVRYSLDQTRYLRNWHSKSNFWLRNLISMLGFGLNFEDEYFFFAVKR